MRQLVELQKQAVDFKKLNAELVFVFREETGGAAALQKIKEKYQTDFTLTLDLEKKSSKAYSSKQRTFNNYVIDRDGIVAAEIDGTLRERATAEQLLKILKKLNAESDTARP